MAILRPRDCDTRHHSGTRSRRAVGSLSCGRDDRVRPRRELRRRSVCSRTPGSAVSLESKAAASGASASPVHDPNAGDGQRGRASPLFGDEHSASTDGCLRGGVRRQHGGGSSSGTRTTAATICPAQPGLGARCFFSRWRFPCGAAAPSSACAEASGRCASPCHNEDARSPSTALQCPSSATARQRPSRRRCCRRWGVAIAQRSSGGHRPSRG